MNRILPTFSRSAGPPYHWLTADRPVLRNVANRSHATRSEVVLLHGDWGRNPNLRGSAPTPGIGLRRKIHKRFQSITTPEHFTSQTCPCCRERSLKKREPDHGSESSDPGRTFSRQEKMRGKTPSASLYKRALHQQVVEQRRCRIFQHTGQGLVPAEGTRRGTSHNRVSISDDGALIWSSLCTCRRVRRRCS